MIQQNVMIYKPLLFIDGRPIYAKIKTTEIILKHRTNYYGTCGGWGGARNSYAAVENSILVIMIMDNILWYKNGKTRMHQVLIFIRSLLVIISDTRK